MLRYYTMTLIYSDALRQIPPKALPIRYLNKVLSMGRDKRGFSEIAEEFLYWCQYASPRPLAKTTLDTYKRTIGLITKHFGDTPLVDITLEHIMNLRKDLMDRGSSQGYLHKILMIIRQVLRHASDKLQMNVLFYQLIELPPKSKPDVKFWSEHELNQILSSIPNDTLHGIRMKAILTTILDTGMRISEVMSLDRDSIDWGDKSAYIIGKGNKERKVLFQDWSLWWIQQYLNQRKDDHPAMFVVHQSGYPLVRLQPDDVRRVFRRIARKTGITTFRPHIGRKTAGTRMWSNGADIQDVQVFLGHERIQTTQIYVGKDYDRVRRVQKETLQYAGAADTGTVATIRWAKEHDKCLNCGKTEVRHAGQGYCYNCYMNWKNAQKRAQNGVEKPT